MSRTVWRTGAMLATSAWLGYWACSGWAHEGHDHGPARRRTGSTAALDLEGLKKFHGHLGPYLILGARAVELATQGLGVPATRLSAVVSCHLNSPERCMADAVQFCSDATYGRGRIAVLRSAVPRMHFVDQETGDTAVLVLTDKARALLARLPGYSGPGTDSDQKIEALAREAATMSAAELWQCRVLRLSDR